MDKIKRWAVIGRIALGIAGLIMIALIFSGVLGKPDTGGADPDGPVPEFGAGRRS